jgi:hypothetical protein
MRNKGKLLLLLLLLALSVVTVIAVAANGPTGGFALDWWTADGGGRTSQGGSFALSGTIGQADAGQLTGGPYELTGGFWNEAIKGISGFALSSKTYLPVAVKK